MAGSEGVYDQNQNSVQTYGRYLSVFNRARAVLMLLALVVLTPLTGVSTTANAKDGLPVITAFGDSLTAGYGLPGAESFPTQLSVALEAAGQPVQMINAGVSGDTTAGGAARIDWTLSDNPDVLIVELGANDGLRGVDPAETRRNLGVILDKALAANVTVVFTGMLAPPNLGPEFEAEFNTLFPELAAARPDVLFYPFFLDGVVADPALNQRDGIHPNAEGVAVIVEKILPIVMKALEHHSLS